MMTATNVKARKPYITRRAISYALAQLLAPMVLFQEFEHCEFRKPDESSVKYTRGQHKLTASRSVKDLGV